MDIQVKSSTQHWQILIKPGLEQKEDWLRLVDWEGCISGCNGRTDDSLQERIIPENLLYRIHPTSRVYNGYCLGKCGR